jgi:hypothetical protein
VNNLWTPYTFVIIRSINGISESIVARRNNEFKLFTKLDLLRDQPTTVSEMKPLTLDREYDNVLLGQGYRTPHGAVIDEYGAMVE